MTDEEFMDKVIAEQEFIDRIIGGDLNAMLQNLDLCIQEQAEEEAAAALAPGGGSGGEE